MMGIMNPASFLQRSARKGASFRKIWQRLSAVAVLSIILPILVLGVLFYSNWKESQDEAFARQTLNRLKSVSLTIQQNFNMIDNDLLLMKTSSDFYGFKKMKAPGEYVQELQDVSSRLADICTKYSFVQSAYFYDSRSRSFVTNTYGTYSYEHFYDREWLDGLDASYQVVRLPVRLNADGTILSDAKRRRTLMYSPEQVITIAGTGINDIRLAINISASGFYQYLNQIYTFGDCDFCVVTGEGEIVLAADPSRVGRPYGADLSARRDGVLRADGRMLFVNPMENNQLLCVMSFLEDVNAPSYAYFKSYIFVLCLLVTAVVATISTLLTRQIYSPVTELFQAVRDLSGKKPDETGARDDLSTIKALYGELESDRRAMESTRLVYARAMRGAAFRNYLEGLISYERMRGQLAGQLEFEGLCCRFVLLSVPCALLCCDGEAPQANLTEIMETYIGGAGQGLFQGMEKNIFMAFLAQEGEDRLDATAEMIHRLMEEILGCRVFAGQCDAENPREDLIPASQRALDACRHAAFFETDGIIPAEKLPVYPEFDYSFVVNAEARLIRSALSCQREEIARRLRDLHEQVLRTPEVHFARSVYLRLLTTLVKELNLSALFDFNIFERFHRLETLREIEEHLGSLLREAVSRLENSPDSQNRYCAQAKAFLEENYGRDISVCDIADELGISYPYLSKLFKDGTGMGLLDCLNQIRVEKSKEYLLGTGDNLNTIARKVGYRNCQSYQRFFKKRTGMTPGEYRRAHASNLQNR